MKQRSLRFVMCFVALLVFLALTHNTQPVSAQTTDNVSQGWQGAFFTSTQFDGDGHTGPQIPHQGPTTPSYPTTTSIVLNPVSPKVGQSFTVIVTVTAHSIPGFPNPGVVRVGQVRSTIGTTPTTFLGIKDVDTNAQASFAATVSQTGCYFVHGDYLGFANLQGAFLPSPTNIRSLHHCFYP